MDARISAGVVGSQFGVSLVGRFADLSKIGKRVIRAIAIDVIDLSRWPSTRLTLPNNQMGQDWMAVDLSMTITAGIDRHHGWLPRVDRIPVVLTRSFAPR